MELTFEGPSLQEKFSPKSVCFGCGPANENGLHVRSFPSSVPEDGRLDLVIAQWKPESKYEAFPGMLNGGIIGALLDCHSNWTAANHLMKKTGLEQAPCSVTADFHVKLKRPTPSSELVTIKAWIAESKEDRALVQAELIVGGKICATCEGNFVAVKPGHPAYHRW
jgi:acyl-coenzyme A thioesterase PaaI-like protein